MTLSQEKRNSMEFETIIGLEFHIQMKTKSKMFSTAPVSFGDEPNTHVAPLDMAFPGALPLVNKQAVINAIRVCAALHMSIDNELWFDRKNYFYSDLPKGYQITQQNRPIGKNGYLDIDGKRINIERLHLEEDTCKQLHLSDYSLLDFNRAGIPLLEIVTLPEIRSGEEAMKFAEKIRSIVTFLDVSDGKMEQGSLRCDVNVSIREKGKKEFGPKVEIKNLNSISNIRRAIDFEIQRQKELFIKGEKVRQDTRRYDEKNKKTISMRLKTDTIDYKFFVDANIVPIRLSQEFIDSTIKASPELAEIKLERYLRFGIKESQCSTLLSNKDLSVYFDEVLNSGADPILSANWVTVDVLSMLNKREMDIVDFPIEPERLGQLIKLISQKRISNKQARELFTQLLNCKDSPEALINQDSISEEEITKHINDIIENNPQCVSDYKKGRDKVVGFIVGQVMKITQGKADPSLTNKLVLEELQRR